LAVLILRQHGKRSQFPALKTPREAIKQAYQIDLIDDGRIWLEALTKRNLITHTYDDHLAEQLVKEIIEVYYPILKKIYEKLGKEQK
jgi:nucleotidyltransferase substrate binding protein (TIGR01987 family)